MANTITRFKITKEDPIAHNRALDLLYAVFTKGSFEEKLSRLSGLGFQADTSIAKEVEKMVALPEAYEKIGYDKGMEKGIGLGVEKGIGLGVDQGEKQALEKVFVIKLLECNAQRSGLILLGRTASNLARGNRLL